jgi:hypothetical protein
MLRPAVQGDYKREEPHTARPNAVDIARPSAQNSPQVETSGFSCYAHAVRPVCQSCTALLLVLMQEDS